PISVKNLGQKWKPFAQRISHVVHVIKLRIRPGKDRSVGGRGQRNLGIGARESRSYACKGVEIWRKATVRTKECHAVGACSVQGNEDDIEMRQCTVLGSLLSLCP